MDLDIKFTKILWGGEEVWLWRQVGDAVLVFEQVEMLGTKTLLDLDSW